jgi:hypothetical protein
LIINNESVFLLYYFIIFRDGDPVVKGTKKVAEKKLAEMLHQLDTGMFIKPGKILLADYLKQWLKDYY